MKKVKFTKETLGVILILMLSAILNFANIDIEGYANTYYAAGVKSMMMNIKNFFFVSFDPAGFVTIDKPPLGFWLQTISAKAFGFSGGSIIFPQALAGVISVWVIYYLVKRSFGSIAGMISALCLAVTPIFVAASRNNTIDNLLVLFLLLACWALLIAAEKGRFKFLIISFTLVGVGFNIKMLEAYMVVPALYITYLLSSAILFKKRIKHLAIGTLVLLLVSLSWALAVDLVPTADRPFVGSSTDNTVIELILGHNGLERIGIGKKSKDINENKFQTELQQRSNSEKLTQIFRSFSRQKGQSGSNSYDKDIRISNSGVSGGMGNISKPGMTRLFSNNNLSDQISWFLPLAFCGFLAATIKEKLNIPLNNKKEISLILWLAWLVPECIYFSFTKGSFHTYYLTTMAPSIAALIGIGIPIMWEFYEEGQWKAWLLPMSFIIDGLLQIVILYYNHTRSNIYKIIILMVTVLCLQSSIMLIIMNVTRYKNKFLDNSDEFKFSKVTLSKILASIAFMGLLLAPTVWSFTPMIYQMNGSSPFVGLELLRNNQKENSNINSNSKLVDFLEANKKHEKYLVAVPSATNYASDIILKTGESVMTIGGFSGSDKIITLAQFKKLVEDGEIRYAMVNVRGPIRNSSNNDIMNWIKKSGKVVPESVWKSGISNNKINDRKDVNYDGKNSVQLYDLKNSTKTLVKSNG